MKLKCRICEDFFNVTLDEHMAICEECYKRELAGPIDDEEYEEK